MNKDFLKCKKRYGHSAKHTLDTVHEVKGSVALSFEGVEGDSTGQSIYEKDKDNPFLYRGLIHLTNDFDLGEKRNTLPLSDITPSCPVQSKGGSE